MVQLPTACICSLVAWSLYEMCSIVQSRLISSIILWSSAVRVHDSQSHMKMDLTCCYVDIYVCIYIYIYMGVHTYLCVYIYKPNKQPLVAPPLYTVTTLTTADCLCPGLHSTACLGGVSEKFQILCYPEQYLVIGRFENGDLDGRQPFAIERIALIG